MMFYWNKCVSVNILICARINSTKTLCFGRKKQQELCLIKSVSLTFSKSSTQNKCVSFNILICARIHSTKTLCFGRKKHQEIKSVSIINSTKTNVFQSIFNMCKDNFWPKPFVSGRKKQQELCLIIKCFYIFKKCLLSQMCIIFLICDIEKFYWNKVFQ